MGQEGAVGPKLFGRFEFNSVSIAGRRNVSSSDVVSLRLVVWRRVCVVGGIDLLRRLWPYRIGHLLVEEIKEQTSGFSGRPYDILGRKNGKQEIVNYVV